MACAVRTSAQATRATTATKCTRDRCNFPDGLCERWNERGDLCDFDGLAGRCKDGGCHEDLCPGVVCDDGNLCTDDYCDWFTGTCRVHERYCPINDGVCLLFTCDPADGSCVRTTEVAPDGTRCGMWEECQNGECVCTSLWCG